MPEAGKLLAEFCQRPSRSGELLRLIVAEVFRCIAENLPDLPAVHVHDDAARLLDRLALLLIEDMIGDCVRRISENAKDIAIAPADTSKIARATIDRFRARLRVTCRRSVLNEAADTFVKRREIDRFRYVR